MDSIMIMDLIFLGHLWVSISVVILIGIFVHHLVKRDHHKNYTLNTGTEEYQELISSQNIDEDATCIRNALGC